MSEKMVCPVGPSCADYGTNAHCKPHEFINGGCDYDVQSFCPKCVEYKRTVAAESELVQIASARIAAIVAEFERDASFRVSSVFINRDARGNVTGCETTVRPKEVL